MTPSAVPIPQRRAVVYLRVSKDPNDGDPRFAKVSPEAQLERCTQKIDLEHWEQGPVFRDINVSHADLEHRVQWTACLEELQPGDVLVVYEQSRVSRSRYYWENLYQSIKERGIALCLLNLNLDTTTPEGEFFLAMSWGLSQLEVEILKRRIRDGKRLSREMGRVQGGPRVYGLEHDPASGKGCLRIVPDEAVWIQFVFTERAKHTSYPVIARRLRDEGVVGPGKKNKATGEVQHGPITSSVLARWCTQPLYLGQARYAGELYPVNVDPIISCELWDQVQAVNAERSRKGVRKSTHLMSSLCRCAKCGEVLTRHRRCDERITWVCSMRQNSQNPKFDNVKKENRCKGVYIEEWALEEYVLSEFFKHLDLQRLAEAEKIERARQFTDHSRIDMLRRQIDTVVMRQNKLLDAYTDGAIGKDELARKNKKHNADLSRFRTELNEASITSRQAEERVVTLDSVRKTWEDLDLASRKRALSLFIEKITVHPGKQNKNPIEIIWRPV